MAQGPEPYDLVLSPAARRAINSKLPEAVATAVVEFLTVTIIHRPRRVGKRLQGDLDGSWSARRSTYRIIYQISEEPREVFVTRIDHRRDVYRPR